MKEFLWSIFLFGVILVISPFYTKEANDLYESHLAKKKNGQPSTTEEALTYWTYRIVSIGPVMALSGFVGLLIYYIT